MYAANRRSIGMIDGCYLELSLENGGMIEKCKGRDL